MKIIAIVGTNAKKSYNRKLLQFMQKHFEARATIEILDITDVPMFNQSDNQTNSAIIQSFNEKLSLVMVSLLQLRNITILFLHPLKACSNG